MSKTGEGGIGSPPKSSRLVPGPRLTSSKTQQNPFTNFGHILFTKNDYTHTDTETDRQTDRQTERHTQICST